MDEKNDSVETFIKEADLFLENIDTASTFSNQGFQEFKKSVNKYICELITESIKASRSYKEKIIYPKHVQIAVEKLYFQYKSNLKGFLSTIGGVILGVSITNFYLMIINNSFTTNNITFSAITLFLGTVLILNRF